MTMTAERAMVTSTRETMTMTVGDFLLRRIREAGVGHAFGVPGDYNLELLQQMEDTGTLEWVGTCNELNASYAADGYARLNGMAALIVTNAVGALSAINGIAGSYAEHVPVICVCGSIPLKSIERGLGMHHTMADGTWDRFINAYAQVTAAQARLTPDNAVTEIDRLILTAWQRQAPGVHGAAVGHRLPRHRGPGGPAGAGRAAQRPRTAAGRAPPRSPTACRRPSRRRSWWTWTPTGTAPRERS